MTTSLPLALLGGLSPDQFMKRHWQKKPLLVRQAIPGFSAVIPRAQLLKMAEQEQVQSRLLQRTKGQWKLTHGPLGRRSLPSLTTPQWTVLLQSMDRHHDGIRALMDQFRFVPDARLDDLMISFATDGGGVGPHFDSYDVFLLQAQGTRRWHFGRQKDLSLQPGLPLKILTHFEPEFTFDLEPGDMLYLPPRYAHDGVAVGECMTYSIGFRAPSPAELAGQLLGRMADIWADQTHAHHPYTDPWRTPTEHPAHLPDDLLTYAQQSIEQSLKDKNLLKSALGEWLTEPGPTVWFDEGHWPADTESIQSVALNRQTKMLYQGSSLFINGETLVAAGTDKRLMQKLADQRCLSATDMARLTGEAQDQLAEWVELGWLDVKIH